MLFCCFPCYFRVNDLPDSLAFTAFQSEASVPLAWWDRPTARLLAVCERWDGSATRLTLTPRAWAALVSAVPASVAACEPCPITAFVVSHGRELRGTLLTVTTDSEAAFHAINAGDSSEPGMFALLELLAGALRTWGIRMLAEWAPREKNFEPDLLSKFEHPHQHTARLLPLLPLTSALGTLQESSSRLRRRRLPSGLRGG